MQALKKMKSAYQVNNSEKFDLSDLPHIAWELAEVGTGFSRATLNCAGWETVRSLFILPLSLNIHRALHQKRQASVHKILICYMNSVLVAEHHKILEADILWEMCVCIIVDYIVILPLFRYALISCRQFWFCIP